MKKTLQSLAVTVAAVLGTAGMASAQQWAPAGYQPPSAGPYRAGVTPAASLQDSPSDRTTAETCVDKAGAGSGLGSFGEDCDDCRGSFGLWGGVEYLFFWPKGRTLPPLVTTSNPPNVPQAQAGVLGYSTTSILFGNDRIGDQVQSAGRLTLGKWFDDEEAIGLGVRVLGTQGDRTSFALDSAANPTIGRPFYNIDPLVNAQDALLVAYPGLTTGAIAVNTSSDMWQADVLGRVNLDYGNNHRLDLVGGYQYTRLDDGLTINSLSTVVGGNMPLGSTFAFRDAFDAKNTFNGGSIGVWYEHCRGPWMVSTLAKFSVGQMAETLVIGGSNTATIAGGGPSTTPGGLLAQPTNIGTYKRQETAFVPELAFNLNRRLTDHLDLTIGYTIIYFSSVILAGDQIDTVVNGSQLGGGPLIGPARPAFGGFNDSDYFVQALSLGVNFHF